MQCTVYSFFVSNLFNCVVSTEIFWETNYKRILWFLYVFIFKLFYNYIIFKLVIFNRRRFKLNCEKTYTNLGTYILSIRVHAISYRTCLFNYSYTRVNSDALISKLSPVDLVEWEFFSFWLVLIVNRIIIAFHLKLTITKSCRSTTR